MLNYLVQEDTWGVKLPVQIKCGNEGHNTVRQRCRTLTHYWGQGILGQYTSPIQHIGCMNQVTGGAPETDVMLVNVACYIWLYMVKSSEFRCYIYG